MKIPSETFGQAFPYAHPKRWKNKLNGKEVKALPWFQPIDTSSAFDFAGFMKELLPEIFEGDAMADLEVYKGLVMNVGWQIQNEHDVWFCFPKSVAEQFEDLGFWHEKGEPTIDPGPPKEP